MKLRIVVAGLAGLFIGAGLLWFLMHEPPTQEAARIEFEKTRQVQSQVTLTVIGTLGGSALGYIAAHLRRRDVAKRETERERRQSKARSRAEMLQRLVEAHRTVTNFYQEHVGGRVTPAIQSYRAEVIAFAAALPQSMSGPVLEFSDQLTRVVRSDAQDRNRSLEEIVPAGQKAMIDALSQLIASSPTTAQ